ncbi:hypothetical protein FGG08_006198 [Glutinoglossum americanum]|uniref:protein-tyrosine-phosphatase n=1 Tax=Glutinoglossum americanum TaxID=1670608 RepID=A0A9P8I5R4_9PEZI|nr:hypothetical protein FGG08_006198 [Glutinoglossum americanum]
MGKSGKRKAENARAKKQPAVCIVPNLLYLGPLSATSNLDFLRSEGIVHVLSIGRSASSHFDISIDTPQGSRQLQYSRLALIDDKASDIGPCVDSACEIIDREAAEGGKVLIHCSAAISRSPTIVAGYLMKRCGFSLRESLDKLVTARDAISPNPGFLAQLCAMEAEIFDGETTFNVPLVGGRTKLANYLLAAPND